MWPVFWTVVRTYAPYVTFPVAFVVGAVGYHLEWFIRGKDPQPMEEEKSISERREDRKLDELLGKDHTQVVPPLHLGGKLSSPVHYRGQREQCISSSHFRLQAGAHGLGLGL
uniref:Small integral membrane protein 12 n=1 Tax=Sciurus vulgaris TaxID=55149 RepID=A0A8D2AH53_SCIVU